MRPHSRINYTSGIQPIPFYAPIGILAASFSFGVHGSTALVQLTVSGSFFFLLMVFLCLHGWHGRVIDMVQIVYVMHKCVA